MSRRGCSLPANVSGCDPHRASISSRFGQVRLADHQHLGASSSTVDAALQALHGCPPQGSLKFTLSCHLVVDEGIPPVRCAHAGGSNGESLPAFN
jgi:hypothetical protein